MHPSDISMGEVDSSDEVVASEESEEDDPYKVNNFIHDVHE